MVIRGLESIDGQRLDGLDFCRRAYAAFDEIRNGPNGIEELRLLTTRRSKRLVEEVLPLANYLQQRYSAGLRIQIRWRGGSQGYDAYLTCTGADIEGRGTPKRAFLEITTAVHPNSHLVREHLHKKGGAFGPRATRRDPKTREVQSEPSIYGHREREDELIGQILKVVRRKAGKRYPKPTFLLVRCVVHFPILDDEWDYVGRTLAGESDNWPFREVALVEPISQRMKILYARPIRRQV